jgi:hypothetical protein
MIDAELAEFLQQGVGINIGTRNAALEPNASMAVAAAVESGGTHLVIYLPTVAAGPILDDLLANGQAAIVFARPQDDRACQVKGTFVSQRHATDDEHALVHAQWSAFLRQLDLVGTPGESTRTWITWPCVAVRLRVTALFSQTPGPDAGAALT